MTIRSVNVLVLLVEFSASRKRHSNDCYHRHASVRTGNRVSLWRTAGRRRKSVNVNDDRRCVGIHRIVRRSKPNRNADRAIERLLRSKEWTRLCTCTKLGRYSRAVDFHVRIVKFFEDMDESSRINVPRLAIRKRWVMQAKGWKSTWNEPLLGYLTTRLAWTFRSKRWCAFVPFGSCKSVSVSVSVVVHTRTRYLFVCLSVDVMCYKKIWCSFWFVRSARLGLSICDRWCWLTSRAAGKHCRRILLTKPSHCWF